MKKPAIVLLALSLFAACNYKPLPSGLKNANTTVVTEVRPVSGFQGVKVANNIALEVTVGADFNVSVEGDESLVKTVSTAVEEGRLVVNVSEKHSRSTKIAVKVSMPELKELEISGGSTALVTGAKGDKIRLQANNATNIRISGEVKALEAHAYGASVIDAEGLKTGTADVEALGSTKVTVSPSSSLKARTVGTATVTYTGDPKVEKNTSDTSSVKKKE